MGNALSGRTILLSGGSRGIGLANFLATAREGANALLLAKTGRPDPRLPGTVPTAVAEIEAAGGLARAVVWRCPDTEDTERAVAEAVEEFGGVDIVMNNASAIALIGTSNCR